MKRDGQKIAATGACLAFLLYMSAAGGALEFEFDSNNFDDSTTLENDFWGLRIAGPTSAILFSESDDGCEVSEATIPAGSTTGFGFFNSPYDINAVVIRDREWVSEECDGNYTLVEDTYDWYAEDNDGNVWYMGEDTTAWDEEENCLTSAGSWKAGDDGAEPGVIMLADPSPGVSYLQEYYEGEAEDQAKVLRLNATVFIEYQEGEYLDCLQTKEYTALAPGEVEHKFYCRLSQGGVGLTLINELKGKTKRVEYAGTSKPSGSFPETFPTVDLCSE
jgi:hypothetical protein